MIIYFDECYDKEHKYLILGALFNPKPKSLHRNLLAIKRKNAFIDHQGYLKEVKYRNCYCAKNISNAVFLADELTRCDKDRFIELMKDMFSYPGSNYYEGKTEPILKHIAEVPSHLEQYQVLQICDLLTGCILNNLIPTKNRYKNMIRNYLVKKLGVENLLEDAWKSIETIKHISRKFRIWYWHPKKET